MEVSLLTCSYTFFHYVLMPDGLRTLMFPFNEILRANLMTLITYYYLKMASEEIIQKKLYT
jgi:hypothetical protein